MLKTTQQFPHSSRRNTLPAWGWVHGFILVQFACQLLLLFPQFGVLRVPMRIASFAISLLLLVLLPGDGPRHPATWPAIGVLVIMAVSFCFHPFMNSFMAGAAQCGMYAAILGPLFWVTRLKITPNGFKWLIFLLWGFHTLSAIFGVLQVYFPGQYQPFLSTAIQNSTFGGDQLLITLANGEQTYRPMGLTDTPGGAASAGFYALLLGVGIALQQKKTILRVACIFSSGIGLFCIYLSQVRSVLVMAGVCLLCLAVLLAKKGEFGRMTAIIGGGSALFMATFAWAVAKGGESTVARFSSLFAERADAVYYQSRGHFLEDTFNFLLPQYPLGAGLGRWGQINGYFGDLHNPLSYPLWAEIQWTGWLYDGGLPLIIAYVLALLLACQTAWKIAMNRQLKDLNLWGGLMFAYNIGALALTFNYPLFISQGGMEFWLLNTALFVAAYNEWMQDNQRARRIRA